jgi:flagellar P-ring protein precursor FlgI
MHMKAAFAAGLLRVLVTVLVLVLAFSVALSATEPVTVKIRDLTSIEGVRENPLIGYGMVVGLTRTGDSQQTAFTTQTLANIMQRMGAQIPAATARVNNVASVFVTASLPAFARPGTQVDVTVSSIGDAKSLEGGLLLLTPLYGADGQVYAAAQGPIAVGGFAAGGAGATKQLNHPTVGRIPAGGRVERSLAFDFNHLAPVSLLLREADFSTAGEISDRHQPRIRARRRERTRWRTRGSRSARNRRGQPDSGPRQN